MQVYKSTSVIMKTHSTETSKRSSLLNLTQKLNDLIEQLDDFNARGFNFVDIAKLNYLNNTLLAALTEFANEEKNKLENLIGKLLKQTSDMLLEAIQRIGNEHIKTKESMATLQRDFFKMSREIS